ncbi:recombinase family protein [Sphingomonas sp. TX0543]|uniref:recombinase family protein n=1 Tax=unclassified Sphingomonas TaxID=196159 RepID=UPI00148526C5|nr:recombinase family protein [Sphingomonas sp. 3P27F8]
MQLIDGPSSGTIGTPHLRAAIYARCGAVRQSLRSIEDQWRNCRVRAGRDGLEVVEAFSDIAASGAVTGSGGLEAMLARADEFDVIVIETLDRLGRDPAVANAFRDRIETSGCELVISANVAAVP